MSVEETKAAADGHIGTRWPELGMAAFLMGLGVTVILDSLRVGTDWAEDGPRSGYFPFFIGMILLIASTTVLLKQLWQFKRRNPVFAEHGQLRLVFSVLWPTAVYVALIAPLGLYVASFTLIGYFMRRHGRYGWLVTVLAAVGLPLSCYLVFEHWFHVPLPKGPLEQWLGL
jgi:putative tricarboxylic transport membrane protein